MSSAFPLVLLQTFFFLFSLVYSRKEWLIIVREGWVNHWPKGFFKLQISRFELGSTLSQAWDKHFKTSVKPLYQPAQLPLAFLFWQLFTKTALLIGQWMKRHHRYCYALSFFLSLLRISFFFFRCVCFHFLRPIMRVFEK